MFDVGFFEMLLLAGIALVVVGPERLPEVARKLGRWIGSGKRMVADMKRQIEDEVGLDKIQHQLHEDSVVEDIKGADLGFTELAKSDNESSKAGRWPGMPPSDD